MGQTREFNISERDLYDLLARRGKLKLPLRAQNGQCRVMYRRLDLPSSHGGDMPVTACFISIDGGLRTFMGLTKKNPGDRDSDSMGRTMSLRQTLMYGTEL